MDNALQPRSKDIDRLGEDSGHRLEIRRSLLTSDWFAQIGDDPLDLGQCVGSQLSLCGFGSGIGFFEG
jgi:hypothetical protein